MRKEMIKKLTITQSTMSELRRICPLLVIVSLLVVNSVLLGGCNSAQVDGTIVASGFIEGEEVIVASEVSGHIAEMMVDRGDVVRENMVLIRLDDAVLQSQRLEAEAALAAASANPLEEITRTVEGKARRASSGLFEIGRASCRERV